MFYVSISRGVELVKSAPQPGIGDSFLFESHPTAQPVEAKIVEESTFFRRQERRVACLAAISGLARGPFKALEHADQRRVGLDRIVVMNVIERHRRTDLDADPAGPPAAAAIASNVSTTNRMRLCTLPPYPSVRRLLPVDKNCMGR